MKCPKNCRRMALSYLTSFLFQLSHELFLTYCWYPSCVASCRSSSVLSGILCTTSAISTMACTCSLVSRGSR